MGDQKGVTLIEVLVGIALIAVICITTLNYFSYGVGGIGRQGNRRAALERARQRLEELAATNATSIQPSDTNPHWLTCAGSPCSWTIRNSVTPETIQVGTLNQRMETTVQWVDDPSVTPGITTDTLAIGVKVWFTSDTTDDEYHRVYLRTLRTP